MFDKNRRPDFCAKSSSGTIHSLHADPNYLNHHPSAKYFSSLGSKRWGWSMLSINKTSCLMILMEKNEGLENFAQVEERERCKFRQPLLSWAPGPLPGVLAFGDFYSQNIFKASKSHQIQDVLIFIQIQKCQKVPKNDQNWGFGVAWYIRKTKKPNKLFKKEAVPSRREGFHRFIVFF